MMNDTFMGRPPQIQPFSDCIFLQGNWGQIQPLAKSQTTIYNLINEAITVAAPNLIRILSVEDHPVFREGLSTIIASQPDMVLVAQASNAAEAMAEFRHHQPDVTLMDLRLP